MNPLCKTIGFLWRMISIKVWRTKSSLDGTSSWNNDNNFNQNEKFLHNDKDVFLQNVDSTYKRESLM